ncbi:hypothetical protein K466DRAFT_566204, partial [Polyporus arcularius HHB13444]
IDNPSERPKSWIMVPTFDCAQPAPTSNRAKPRACEVYTPFCFKRKPRAPLPQKADLAQAALKVPVNLCVRIANAYESRVGVHPGTCFFPRGRVALTVGNNGMCPCDPSVFVMTSSLVPRDPLAQADVLVLRQLQLAVQGSSLLLSCTELPGNSTSFLNPRYRFSESAQ